VWRRDGKSKIEGTLTRPCGGFGLLGSKAGAVDAGGLSPEWPWLCDIKRPCGGGAGNVPVRHIDPSVKIVVAQRGRPVRSLLPATGRTPTSYEVHSWGSARKGREGETTDAQTEMGSLPARTSRSKMLCQKRLAKK